jgi:lysophospholipase L1-like esterase
MRKLRLLFAVCAAGLGACAADPNYGTGSGGSSAGGTGAGGAGGSGATGGGGAAGAYTPPALTIAHPNPIISRGKPVMSSPANGNAVVNTAYHNGGWGAGKPTADAPAWVAINVGAGPTRVLVSWDDGGTYNYEDPATTTVYGFPADYHFEVSPDGTTWTAAGTPVTGNTVRTRAHSLDFTGMAWVKMVITAAPANESSNGVQIGEIDVHDISATGAGLPDDTWFFMGDSITAFAYDRAASHQPSFAAGINTAKPTYFPAMINGGIGGELTTGALARLDEVLALNPDYRFICLTYGTNDEWGNHTDASGFKANLQMMIDKITAAGRTPILSHIPFSDDGNHGTLPTFNAAIDELTRSNQLQVGPDFYGYFMQHPDQLMDHVHPNDAGRVVMNQMWTDAAKPLYP